jgi:hypothetical protein
MPVPAHAANPNMISTADALHYEQVAQNRGVLTGLVAGYLFGRHRGKKIGRRRAEKEFKPVQRAFEDQVETLQFKVAEKEKSIRQLARDKFDSLRGKKVEQEQLVNHLRGGPEKTSAPDTAHRARSEVAVAVGAPLLAAGELYSRAGLEKGEIPMAVEVPINPRHAEAAAVVSSGEAAPIIPFGKKAEDFSHEELRATAEKLKVQGVSLKEMAELGRIDERGLRRVVNEFIRGGDISRAVAREVKEKELQYERDPKLRRAANSGAGDMAGAGSGGLLATLTGSSTPKPEESDYDKTRGAGPGNPKAGPAPDPGTLRALRNQQIKTVALTTALVVAVVILLIVAAG